MDSARQCAGTSGVVAKEQLRRFVCGFYEEEEARRGGGTRVRKQMLRMVRDSGLEVQRAAKEAAKTFETEMVDYGNVWAGVRRLAARWVMAARQAGPGRLVQMREIGFARGRARVSLLWRLREMGGSSSTGP